MDLEVWIKILSCCTPYLGGILTGIYSTVTYLTAFGMELGWIIEAEEKLPSPAYILTAGYFCTFLVSLFLLVGLMLKHCRYLLIWLIVMLAFFFPECGLVLYMSLYHWDLGTPYGLAEFVFYVCRAVLNVLCVVCIHLLYGSWRKEKRALHRLENFQVGTIYSHLSSVSCGKENVNSNNDYLYRCAIQDEPNKRINRSLSLDSSYPKNLKNNFNPCRQMESLYGQFHGHKSEFDVATFNQYLAWQLNYPTSIYGTIRYRDTHSDIESNNRRRRSVALYGTVNGLYRPPQRRLLKKSKSLGDLTIDHCILEKLNQSSFTYLHHPNSLVLDDSDNDSLQNISDVAL